VLALIHDEPRVNIVAADIGNGLGTANLAEVIGKMVDAEPDVSRLRECSRPRGVRVEPLLEEDAEFAGALRSLGGSQAAAAASL
jgi:hypothetical protein